MKTKKPALNTNTDLTYIPSRIEPKWQSFWESSRIFESSPEDEKFGTPAPKKNFSMFLPPPNVTGELHIGHTLMVAIQDTIARFYRMKGFKTFWNPGTDHAGIATQTVVERHLKLTENKSRSDFSRKEFLKRVWSWKEQKGAAIEGQIRKLGCSLAWEHNVFTMDPKMVRGVEQAFCRLFDRKLIYRAKRIVNWSCALRTVVADIEVNSREIEGRTLLAVPGYEKKVEFGLMYYFTYRVDGNEDEEIVIATTRPETIVGDVAVAVHPDDQRHAHLIGRKLKHPFVDRTLMVVADPLLVDPELGTGAVKITPAHDQNDFECGQRHGLEGLEVIDEEGLMKHDSLRGTQFYGMKRYECREAIIKKLEEIGQYRGKQDHKMILRTCDRSKDVIEPMLKDQWFLDCAGMTKKVLVELDTKRLNVSPLGVGEEELRRWLTTIRPWCLSRQLWWGHRIPVYYKASDKSQYCAAMSRAEAGEKLGCAEAELEQEEDVLDTWFSSGLFPFVPLGWPEVERPRETHEQGAWTTLLETGIDIIFFWVARMLMLSLELTDRLPFHQVFLHGIVRDKHGAKMSKSKGNVINPLEIVEGISLEEMLNSAQVLNIREEEKKKACRERKNDFPKGIEECGADALRIGILSYMTGENCRGINLDVKRVVGYRHFCNKIWNLVIFYRQRMENRIVVQKLQDRLRSVLGDREEKRKLFESSNHFCDGWILLKLNALIEGYNANLPRFRMMETVNALFEFSKKFLCDVYVEIIKDHKTDLLVAALCVDHLLRMLHPFMPHLTEELWQSILPSKVESDILALASLPEEFLGEKSKSTAFAERCDRVMELSSSIVKKYRSIMAALAFDFKQQGLFSVVFNFVKMEGEVAQKVFEYCRNQLKVIKNWKYAEEEEGGCDLVIKIWEGEDVRVHVEMEKKLIGSKDVGKLVKRLDKFNEEKSRLEKKLKKAKGKMPEEIFERESGKYSEVEKNEKILAEVVEKLKIE